MHSRKFRAENCRLNQLKQLHPNDDKFQNLDNMFLINKTENGLEAASPDALKLWKTAVNITKLLQKIRPKDRPRFFKHVLKRILPCENRLQFDKLCHNLMNRKGNCIRFVDDDNIHAELTALFQSEIELKRELNNTNPQNNYQQEEIVVRPNRVCSRCLKTENVTKCCTHCHRYFDEVCFANIPRKNNDPENLCPDCDPDDAAMEYNTAPNCAPCDVNLPHVDADNLYKCIFHRCLVFYHRRCVPAGAQILSENQMICPGHNDPNRNSDKLKICAYCCQNGTSLLKCKYCPLAFHPMKCLKLTSIRNTEVICEICREGRVLMQANYIYAWFEKKKKWWPATIVSERDVPERVLRSRTMPERDRSGYFWIQFLVTLDFEWKHQSNVLIHRQINRDVTRSMRGKKRSTLYNNACAEADNRIYDEND